eukprot:Pgem_evm1s8914
MSYSNKISPVNVNNKTTLSAKLSRTSLQNRYTEQYTKQFSCELACSMQQTLEKKRKHIFAHKQIYFKE